MKLPKKCYIIIAQITPKDKILLVVLVLTKTLAIQLNNLLLERKVLLHPEIKVINQMVKNHNLKPNSVETSKKKVIAITRTR